MDVQIGASQISFINPPTLKLDFTGAADIADFWMVDSTVRTMVLDLINSMVTLPNRYLYKLDANNDYFKTHLQPLGIVRVSIEKAWGFSKQAETMTGKIISTITRAEPRLLCQG